VSQEPGAVHPGSLEKARLVTYLSYDIAGRGQRERL
jgi:hypothetical protein